MKQPYFLCDLVFNPQRAHVLIVFFSAFIIHQFGFQKKKTILYSTFTIAAMILFIIIL